MTLRALLLLVLIALLGIGAGAPTLNTGSGMPGGVRASDPDSGQGIPGAVSLGHRWSGGQGTLGLTLGRVVDTRGRGVAGARVVVVDGHGRLVGEVVTGRAGTFAAPVPADAVLLVEAPTSGGPVLVALTLTD